MGPRPKQILSLSLLNMGFIILCLTAFHFSGFFPFLFLPLGFTALAICLVSPSVSLGLVLSYVGFDGIIKILSGYNSVLHVGPDIVVLMLTLRWLMDLSVNATLLRRWLPPFWMIFAAHFAWIALEILNPYGLSFLAGLASYKVYVSFLLLYFMAFNFLKSPSEARSLMWVTVALLVVQTLLSIYQFQVGPESVLSISHNYAKVMAEQFVGQYFRPFGTTAVAGGPSTSIFLTVPLLVALMAEDRNIFNRVLIAVLLILACYVMFISQVRSAMIKAIFGMVFTYAVISWRQPWKILLGVASLAMFISSMHFFMTFTDPIYSVAQERLATLTDIEALRESRNNGSWNFISQIWQDAPLGIGLSRVGAAGTPFKDLIMKDPEYGMDWSFADNLYRAISTEIGIPGLIFYFSCLAFPFFMVFRRVIRAPEKAGSPRYLIAGCLGLAAASILGHPGSEGSLYLPECAYFWIFMGSAVKFSEKRFLAYDDSTVADRDAHFRDYKAKLRGIRKYANEGQDVVQA